MKPAGKQRTAANAARDREVRKRFAAKPTLEALLSTGEYEAPVKQGQVLALMRFAAEFKALRQKRRISLATLSKSSGIDRAAISRIENGLAGNPTVQTLDRLAAALGKGIRIELENLGQTKGR